MAKNRQSLDAFHFKEFLKQLLISYFRGVILLATPLSAGVVLCSCLLRNILGRFYSITLLFIPATVGALGIFGAEPKIRLLYSTFFTNFALSAFRRKLEIAGEFKLSLLEKTSAFMVLSAAISAILKRLSDEGKANLYYWFFNSLPENSLSNRVNCCHEHSCRSFILKNVFKYITSGILLSLVRMLFRLGFKVFTSPKKTTKYLLTSGIWRLPAFFGMYSAVFQSLRCMLRRISGKSTVLHNALAGGVAGITFSINPSLTLLNTAIITSAQVLTRWGLQNGYCPDIPYAELFFVVSAGYLIEATILTPKLVPNVVLYILRTATRDRITDHHINAVSKFNHI